MKYYSFKSTWNKLMIWDRWRSFSKGSSLRGCLHEISSRVKWNIFISVSGQFPISYNYLHVQPILTEMNFISGDKICKHYPKWNHMKGNICTCVNKDDWLLLNGPLISDHPRNEIHFISAMESNANRISLMVGWNFFSDLFRFGFYANTL